jgi:hypothetical protein
MAVSVGAALDEAEARSFVGRVTALQRMDDLLRAEGRGPVVLYVHGPAGVGKSALLRAYRRLAAQRGVAAALVDGATTEPGPEGFLRAAAATLGRPGLDSLRAVRRLARARRPAPLLLLVDAYEDLMPLDRWLRHEVFSCLGPGTITVLAGRRQARALWPADPAWRALLEEVALGDLSPAEADELLRRRGLADPDLRREAVALSGGRPLLLVLAAQALAEAASDGRAAAGGPQRAAEHGTTADLLGLLLHPDAARPAWAPGPEAPALDRLLAAAAIVGTFDQPLLEAVAGPEAATTAWAALLRLPVVIAAGGGYTLHEEVRARAAGLIEGERPWLAHAWRQRAIAAHLERTARDPEAAARAWPQVARLARQALWHSYLHPASEARAGWRFERGVRAADYPELARCAEATWRRIIGCGPAALRECHDELRQLVGLLTARFIVARDREGTVRGFHVQVPLTPATRELLTKTISPGVYLRTLAPETLAAWEGRTLCACFLASVDVDAGLHQALMRESCADFYRYDRVVCVSPRTYACGPFDGGIAHFMPMLGMRQVPGFEVRHPDIAVPLSAWCLDMTPFGFAEWLRGITASPPELTEAERLRATREALQAFHDPRALCTGAAAGHFGRRFGSPTAERLRRWLLDGLAQALPQGGDLVRAYYVDRAGTHEEIAATRGLPRRTYFDRLRRGIRAAADILFA